LRHANKLHESSPNTFQLHQVKSGMQYRSLLLKNWVGLWQPEYWIFNMTLTFFWVISVIFRNSPKKGSLPWPEYGKKYSGPRIFCEMTPNISRYSGPEHKIFGSGTRFSNDILCGHCTFWLTRFPFCMSNWPWRSLSERLCLPLRPPTTIFNFIRLYVTSVLP
jgi:hypothetical protein